MIRSLDAGGLAEASQEIKPGDFIVAVNGTNTQAIKDIKEVGVSLRNSSGVVRDACV